MNRLSTHIISLACILFATGADAQNPPVAANPDDTIQLQFPNNGVGDVLGIYELLTGKSVVKESGIFDGKPISLVTSKPINQREAIELIEASLYLNGYV